MKVVVAHNLYSSAQPSGENVVVAAEIEQLRSAGVSVVPFLRSSDEISSLSFMERATLPVSPVYARRAQRSLGELLIRERPDVLHLHNPYPLLSPWVVRTAHAHGVPVVHTIHNFRQTCVNGLFFRDGGDCHECVGKAFALPAVKHACYRGSRAQSVVMATTLAIHRGTWRGVDQMLALTPAMASHVASLGVPAERIVVRPNAVPDPGPHATVGSGFLFAGRLSAEKGLDLLLSAWNRHPDGSLGTLRVVGDGPLADQVRSAADGRGDIEYLGRLDHSALMAAMREAAVVVVPSVWDEVCPMVAVEALANSRPLLATARGGLPFLVGADSPAPAGWVTEPTVEDLAAVLPRVRDEAPGLAGAARDSYQTRFTPEIALDTLLSVYRDVSTRTGDS